MTVHTKRMWDALLDMAEGKASEEASAHVRSCAECTAALTSIRLILAAAEVPYFVPPSSLFAAAYDLMPKKFHRMSLVQSSLQVAGARSLMTEDFQAIYAADELKVRVMYSANGQNWDVLAAVPDASFTAEHEGRVLPISDDLRLLFTVDDLVDAGFTLSRGESHYEIPSPSEVQLDRD